MRFLGQLVKIWDIFGIVLKSIEYGSQQSFRGFFYPIYSDWRLAKTRCHGVFPGVSDWFGCSRFISYETHNEDRRSIYTQTGNWENWSAGNVLMSLVTWKVIHETHWWNNIVLDQDKLEKYNWWNCLAQHANTALYTGWKRVLMHTVNIHTRI